MYQSDYARLWIVGRLDRTVHRPASLDTCFRTLWALSSASTNSFSHLSPVRASARDPVHSCVVQGVYSLEEVDQDDSLFLDWEFSGGCYLIPEDRSTGFGPLEFTVVEGELVSFDPFVARPVSNACSETFLGLCFFGWHPWILVPTAEQAQSRSIALRSLVQELVRQLSFDVLVLTGGDRMDNLPAPTSFVSDSCVRNMGLSLKQFGEQGQVERLSSGWLCSLGNPFWSLRQPMRRPENLAPPTSVSEYRSAAGLAMSKLEDIGRAGFGALNLLTDRDRFELRF